MSDIERPRSNGFRPWAVVVAGGSGRRFGRPKQLEPVAGRRVIDRSVAAMVPAVDGIVVVGPGWLGSADELGVDHRVDGGAERSDSVRRGLAAVPPAATHILIHDAARPLVPLAVVGRVLDALAAGADAVVPVVPVVDSLRRVGGEAVDRAGFVAVQTPQGFRAETIRRAHESGRHASDDATVVEQLGVAVLQVEGDRRAMKITYAEDLALAAALAGNTGSPAGADPVSTAGPDRAAPGDRRDPVVSLRIGQGFDLHPWSPDRSRTLVLGGVGFDDLPGLAGHSDADVVAHACTDAILGAVGLGDIGQLFPDTDAANRGADSIEMLAVAAERLRSRGWTVLNVDCTIVCDRPKIAPVRDSMEQRLSTAVGAPVSVKGKRTEGVAALADGVQCQAVALVSLHGQDER